MKVKTILSIALFFFSLWAFGQELTPAQLVQQQLDGYNQGDIDLFLEPYADTVKMYNHPDKLLGRGKDRMRIMYGNMFSSRPELNCTLMNRMVLGNIVIDQEYVRFSKDQPPTEVIAMYKIAGGKIAEVYFIRPD